MWFIGFNKWSSEKQPALKKDKTRNGPAEGAKKKKKNRGLVWTLPRNSSLTRMFNVKGNVHNCKAILPAHSAASHAEKPVYKRENIGEMDVYWRFVCMIPKIIWKQN